MSHFKNFKTVVYCTAQSMVNISAESLQRQIDFFQKYVGVDKVYLEPYRDDCLIPREQLHLCKELFHKNGIEVAGGITTTISGQGEADAGRQRLFNTYCFCNERMREHLKSMAEYLASEYDEFIIDDFFFTNCTCDDCRRAKGDRSWEEFRLELMKEVSENLILKPARAINPRIKVTIKFPNWMESYQEAGYNPGQLFHHALYGKPGPRPQRRRLVRSLSVLSHGQLSGAGVSDGAVASARDHDVLLG